MASATSEVHEAGPSTKGVGPALVDDLVPAPEAALGPLVGLGGSAGAIPALASFFDAMPADSGLAFVFILHLSPHHESTLDELLGRRTSMPVVRAEDGMELRPNHVYVIPPRKYLCSEHGHLRLEDLPAEHVSRGAVDMFFRSLADSHGPRAIAVVLSGADGDGALGIKRVKEGGGLTIAQDPAQATHPSMPQAAIDTGMIDWVLSVEEIPGRISAYLQSEARIRLPPEDGPPLPAAPSEPVADDGEVALREILNFLRTRTGHDFTAYKRATILRRIARRMQVNGVDQLREYVAFLRAHAGESAALLADLLISITNFFRDREMFAALELVVPRLFAGKGSSDAVRVWIPACATGEEAYSIAMLLVEHAATMASPPNIQVFACDLNQEAIQVARAGHYLDTIAADVTAERLKQHFIRDHTGYRVRRELRERVLFAVHDLLKDAPFSRMDLISCRNLLIYLNRDAQQRVLETFHFALRQDGVLFLGSSESIDDGSTRFGIVDKKHRVYARQGPARPIAVVNPRGYPPATPGGPEPHPPVVHGRSFAPARVAGFDSTFGRDLDRAGMAELHFRLLERYAAPSAILSADHDLVHLSEHAAEYFQFVGGEPTTNALRVVNPSLRVELRAALFRVAETQGAVHGADVEIERGGATTTVRLLVAPAPEIGPGFLLVMFEPADPAGEQRRRADHPAETRESVVRPLERELEQVKDQLRETVEQYEASTEELKASNEELQSMNEELRSATEELETSHEELQSINEELSTVNQELKVKVRELAAANADLQNLMASTAIATVFLDRELTITRFTPSSASIFNLIPSDVGRPLAHLTHHLEYPTLLADAASVLQSLIPIEREIASGERRYLTRLQPYRTLEDHIAGTVLTLVDITERARATEALRQSEERLRLLIESATDYAIFTTDTARRIDTWNRGATALFGYSEAEILGQVADILFTTDDAARGDAEGESQRAADEGRAENERWHQRKDGTVFYGSGILMPLRDRSGGLRGFVTIMRDLTKRKQAEESARQYFDMARFNAAAVGRESRMIELKEEINALCERVGEPPRYATPGPDVDIERGQS